MMSFLKDCCVEFLKERIRFIECYACEPTAWRQMTHSRNCSLWIYSNVKLFVRHAQVFLQQMNPFIC